MTPKSKAKSTLVSGTEPDRDLEQDRDRNLGRDRTRFPHPLTVALPPPVILPEASLEGRRVFPVTQEYRKAEARRRAAPGARKKRQQCHGASTRVPRRTGAASAVPFSSV
ncbi:hypothetical protein EVAR_67129_1 [Eumeta japonica]|uniref:Uncharacterized protein n=1 Tax=Eumeta variegata TaxID=151549 RepID=A0A4C2A043_EUMVA|nr:hypothetical protein EVAR_67129_1 [Eumeta japonica]